MTGMGGFAVYLDHAKPRLGERESIKDVARNLERWVDGIAARTFSHSSVAELAAHASIPVINALTDLLHPCQALSDFFTLREKLGTLDGLKLAYVGDGNNMCHSLLTVAAKLGGKSQDDAHSELTQLGQRLAAADGDLSGLRGLLSSLRSRADEVRQPSGQPLN